MPRLRFTLRRMMIAVAVAGVVACAWEFKSRRDGFLDRVAYHAYRDNIYRLLYESERSADEASAKFAEMRREMNRENSGLQPRLAERDRYPLPLSDAERFPPPAQPPEETKRDPVPYISRAAKYRDRLAWHSAMRAKYERAARNPWLAVGPDLPEPDENINH